jgi:hypothetical protein
VGSKAGLENETANNIGGINDVPPICFLNVRGQIYFFLALVVLADFFPVFLLFPPFVVPEDSVVALGAFVVPADFLPPFLVAIVVILSN